MDFSWLIRSSADPHKTPLAIKGALVAIMPVILYVILKMSIVAVVTPAGPIPASLVQYTIAAAEGFVPARLGI